MIMSYVSMFERDRLQALQQNWEPIKRKLLRKKDALLIYFAFSKIFLEDLGKICQISLHLLKNLP